MIHTFRALSVASIAALSLVAASCSSVSVDPCSRAGVDARMEDSLSDYARSVRGDINDIRQAGRFMGGETTFGAMRIAKAVSALENMIDRFNSDVVPDIQAIQDECGAVVVTRDVFFEFLDDAGVNRNVRDWADRMASMIEDGAAD